MDLNAESKDAGHVSTPGSSAWSTTVELILMVALLFIMAGTRPPAVNEAHYWTKAKHFWDPAWCARDPFLSSANMHYLYFSCFGWLTKWGSLETAAWIGRVAGWMLLAIGWRFLSRTIAPIFGFSLLSLAISAALWHYTHMAGEWVVGGLEAKVVAYALVFFALGCALRCRVAGTLLSAALATAFHPVVGIWAGTSMLFAWRKQIRLRAIRQHRLATVVFIMSMLAILWLTRSIDPAGAATRTEANRVYVDERLPHHLLLHRFSPIRIACFTGLCAMWGVAWSMRRRQLTDTTKYLQAFGVGSLLLVAGGLICEGISTVAPDLAASLLKLYWYRLADVAVPMAFTFLVIEWLVESRSELVTTVDGPDRYSGTLAIALTAVTLAVALVFFEHRLDSRPGADRQTHRQIGFNVRDGLGRLADWRAMCEWASAFTPASSLFLTPLQSQTFRWYAERAELANWKDIPQDAASIVAWWRTIHEVRRSRVYDTHSRADVEVLEKLVRGNNVDYVVMANVPRHHGLLWPIAFRNRSYIVYQVP